MVLVKGQTQKSVKQNRESREIYGQVIFHKAQNNPMGKKYIFSINDIRKIGHPNAV